MNADDVMRWVAKYERAWSDSDVGAVEQLFTEDAHYRPSPSEESEIGPDAIKAFWLDDEGTEFTVAAKPVARGFMAAVGAGCRAGRTRMRAGAVSARRADTESAGRWIP